MKLALGIDVGGTKITGVVWNGKKVLRELTIVTPKTFFEFKRNLLKLVRFLDPEEKIKIMGIGVPGRVDTLNHVALVLPNIKYINNFNLAKFFAAEGLNRVAVHNDADCFLRAECVLGEAKKFHNVIAITLGTGIGGSFLINNEIYQGGRGLGIAVSKIIVDHSYLEMVYKKAKDKKDFKQIGRLMSIGMANLINLIDPQCIVFGGTVSVKRPEVVRLGMQGIRKYLSVFRPTPKFYISKIKNSAAIGAALFALHLK